MRIKNNNIQALLTEKKLQIPQRHAVVVSLIALPLLWLLTQPFKDHTTVLKQDPLNKTNKTPQAVASDSINKEPTNTLDKEAPAIKPLYKEREALIKRGDSLSALFNRYRFDQKTLLNIMSSDESLLALETLKPGNRLLFRYKEETNVLTELELYVHAGFRVVYRRIEGDEFTYETIVKDGEWKPETVYGEIEGSFYLSAQRAGLTESETATVTQIFSDQLDFARAIRKGDKFQIVRYSQFVDGEPTGQTRIDSARVQRRKYEHTAFLFQDGRYYDQNGNSLARAFTRTPLDKTYRISSRFNPKRVHPVTGRVKPHNGTDFATPTGTKVYSAGDGVVTRVGNHKFAGRYIDIQHGGQYKTRYLHLHRIHVRRGETIKRGQIIALSGNTGRSTGPHLHFELHINGKPVDPMTAKIPLSKSLSNEDKTFFFDLVAKQTQLLNLDVRSFPEEDLQEATLAD